MDLIPSAAPVRGMVVMILSFPRLLGLALICLTGFPGSALAMADTAFTRGNAKSVADEETLTWSLLGTALLTFGMVTACGWGIHRHQRRSGPEAEFLDDLRREKNDVPRKKAPPSSPEKTEPQAAWEKPGDWWRQDFNRD